MQAKWQPIPTNTRGLTRFKDQNSGARAYIQRNPDGTALAECRTGFMGLGRSTTIDELKNAPSDDVILGKFEDTVNPPTFSDFKPTRKKGVYKGKTGDATARAEIKRDRGEATVKITSGFFGPSSEGHYFAPAPSDAEILERHSRG